MKQIIMELREDCSCKDVSYCPLEELLTHYQNSDRMFMQHKVVEMFKWIESQNEGRDIGWEESYKRYTQRGFAKAFSQVYNPNLNHKVIYKKMLGVLEK